jgi:predicted permease
MVDRGETPRFGARWFRLPPRNRQALEAQVRQELEAHLALAIDHLVALGASPADAEREARARFGDFDAALRRLYVTARRRETQVHRRDVLDDLRQDTRVALRVFRRSPLFFATAILTLAVGIGANGAVFSILQAALLQPLPYHNPEELVMLRRRNSGEVPWPSMRLPGAEAMTSSMVLGWRRDGTDQLGEVAAILTRANLDVRTNESQFDLTLGDRTARLNGALVTPDFFDLLGVHAARGRLFRRADGSSSDQLIVLSDATWRREFDADPTIIGRPLTLSMGIPRAPRTFTVAGILPRNFRFTYPDGVEAWVMMRWSDVEQHSPEHIVFSAVARLRPGLTLAQARRRAAELPDRLSPGAKQPPHDRIVIGLEPIRDWVVGDSCPSLRLLAAVAALLLLVTCVTVSNALLARISERQQELAVRAALGAGRPRLIRQLLTEGALLSIGGALAGTALAAALQPVLRVLLPASIPRVGEISINAYVLAFGAAMAAVTTILAAVAPAWGGTRFDAAGMLTGAITASATRATLRWRQGLVAAQAAIATALLISATLLLASFWQLGRVPLGFKGERVVTVEVQLLDFKYMAGGWAIRRFQDDLIARLRTIPGIAEIGLASSVPFRGFDYPGRFGRTGSDKTEMAKNRVVDEGYFKSLGIAPVRGRLLNEMDRELAPPVTVISDSYAHKVFGAENPIGQMIGPSPGMQVVGVVRDMRYAGLEQDPTPAIYIPRAQEPRPTFYIVARMETNGSVGSTVTAIRSVVREIDRSVPVTDFMTIGQAIDASVANRRFYTVATAAFATIALLLTVVGLGVVVARVVAERRRELAIRAAMGATMSILATVATRDALAAVCLGVGIGLATAYAGSVVLAQFLFQVAPRSLTTYSSVAALVLCVATLAAWARVRRLDRMSIAGLLKAE